jgi:hypothetical protein
MSETQRISALVVGMLALLAACLPEDRPVDGRLLYPGTNIEHPEFVGLGGEPWVMFEVRQTRSTVAGGGPGGSLAVHLVNWQDPGQHRLLLPSRAERAEWPRVSDGAKALFYMTNERKPEQGLRLPVGTLLRVKLDAGVIETIDDVLNYTVNPYNPNLFIYRKHRPDAAHAELHLRSVDGEDRNLGLLTGQVQFQGPDRPERMYFIGGEDQVMTRVDGLTGELKALRSKVSRFLLHPSERFAIINVSDMGKARTVIFDLKTGAERPLPVENPSNWLELRGEVFVFSEAARGGQPTELHFFDTAPGGLDRKYLLPDSVHSVGSVMGRPPEYRDALIFPAPVTVFRPERPPGEEFEVTNLRPSAPGFTPDGRYLLYLEPEPPPPPPAVTKYPTGKLFAQSTADWTLPPRQLSPKGASVPIDPVGYRQRPGETVFPLLFWARYGLGGSDLYLSNYDTGEFVKVAEGIGAVSVGERHVLGVVRLSQDLTGDLVFRDFVDGREQLVETGVADMHLTYVAGLGDIVAFVVRERRPASRRNGLWAAILEPLPEPDPKPEMAPGEPAPRVVQGGQSLFGVGEGGPTLVRPE